MDQVPGRRAWEQLEEETAQAFEGFVTYLELGPERTIPRAAEALGKSTPLLWRWSSRHRWRGRARAWDRENRRQDEAVSREERDELVRRRRHRADLLGRTGLMVLSKFVRRDPVTGELQVSPDVKPRDAVSVLRLATELEERIDIAAPQTDASPSAEDRIHGLSDAELERLIEVSQQAGNANEEEKEDGATSKDGR
jgi:hypothetical protein